MRSEVRKGIDERIDEGVLRSFGHVVRNRIAKRVYVGVCAGSRSVGRPRKRWVDTAMEFLKKKGVNVRQARRMIQDRSKWREFVRGNE